MDPKILILGLVPFCLSPVFAAEGPSTIPSSAAMVSDGNLALSGDISMLEEGKALYENGQLIAALGKFMTVLRKDPHNEEARQYLRMIIDTMRQNPSITSSKMGTHDQAVDSNPAVQEEIRRMLQLRSRLSMDLKAIPGVQMIVTGNSNQAIIDTPLLFSDNSGGLKEQGIPALDRTAAWLKTYGQQPVIIHCYPEELQDASTNGSLFLHRYSELFNYFTVERKLPPQRFVSADLLTSAGNTSAPISTATARIVIETIGSQSAMLEAMPSITSSRGLSQWLENSIVPNRRDFNPEEGEWISLDLAALTRAGLRSWSFTIVSADKKTAKPAFQIDGKGNLLKRVSWDGHNQTGDFVGAGNYVAKLIATNGDGTIKSQEEIVQVERTTKDVPPLVEQPKPAVKKHAKAVKPKGTSAPKASTTVVAALPSSSAASGQAAKNPPPAYSENDDLIQAPANTASAPAVDDSVHAIWKQAIQFETNQSELVPTVKSSLERIGKTLEVYPLQKVRITGFALTSENNALQLARQRADAVRSILVNEYHVDSKRVIVAGGKTTTAENGSKVEMSITN